MRLHTDTTGWNGGFGSAFAFLKNKNQVISVSANAHLQYKTQKEVYLLLADYNILKSDNEDLSDNMFYHLRYNRKLGEVLRWEVFTQLQRNAVTNIKVRMLAGTGPRFKLHESKKVKLFAATAAMYEYEREQGLLHQDFRNTSYVSFTWLPTDVVTLLTTTYYQPLFSDITDFRIFNQLSLVVKATKHFAITTDWNYLFDNNPAAGVPRYNYAISNGFAYQF